MNEHNRTERNSQAQLRQWWAGVRPLLRRIAPRWGAFAVLAAGLWMAGAHYDARHESLLPQPGLPRIDPKEYLNRGQDIPPGDNAATLYMEAQSLLTDEKRQESYGEDANEALRLYNLLQSDRKKLTPADWQLLEAFSAQTDGAAALVRGARQRPHCVFRLSESRYGRLWFRDNPRSVTFCLAIRARVAAHQGNAPAWRQAMEDLLGFVEDMERDPVPETVGLAQDALKALLAALEDACASGAAGDAAFLAAVDGRLAALRPMAALEPLLVLAWSNMDFRREMQYWGIYPRFFTPDGAPDWNYSARWDIPFQAGGFAARDRMLSVEYLATLTSMARSGEPDSMRQTWSWITAGARRDKRNAGMITAPHYDMLCEETLTSSWYGSPGVLHGNRAIADMTRAAILVMRHGRNESGHFRGAEALRELLKGFPNPMTGEPIICRGDSGFCELGYSVSLNTRRNARPWRVGIRLIPFPPQQP